MKLEKEFKDLKGITWKVAGYSSPRRFDSATYRLIRMTDGARVRVKSNKMYQFDLSRQKIKQLTITPKGTDQSVLRGKKLSDDHKTVGYFTGYKEARDALVKYAPRLTSMEKALACDLVLFGYESIKDAVSIAMMS